MSSRALPARTRDGAPTWESPREWARCVSHRPYLLRTTTTALAVGTLVFCINHLATVLEGDATTGMWLATGFTYLVPFCVSNAGLLVGRRRRSPTDRARAADARAPTWQRLRDCPRCVAHRPYLRRTVATALLVGTVYFAINHLEVLLAGGASTGMWLATGFTYLVPFCVSNLGLLAGRRRPESRC